VDNLLNPRKTDGVMSYLEMAARCREMAEISRHPGPLLRRAEAYEACAEAERLRMEQPSA
jgi:hypothetical protein